MSGYEQDGLPIIGSYKQLVKKGTRLPARELLTKIIKYEPIHNSNSNSSETNTTTINNICTSLLKLWAIC